MHQRNAFSLGRGLAASLAAMLLIPALAGAHARVSPAVSLKGELQLYTLTVPTEKANVTTTKVVLTVPDGFSIDSFVAAPGWHRTVQQTGSGDNAVIQTVAWTGGRVPTGEDALFQFLAQPAASNTYTFRVQQTYSDGSIVDWAGPESSDSPAPAIDVKDSLGGGGTSVLAIIALIVGALGALIGLVALAAGTRGSGRPLV
jgi:uncharacterized protein YcnI